MKLLLMVVTAILFLSCTGEGHSKGGKNGNGGIINAQADDIVKMIVGNYSFENITKGPITPAQRDCYDAYVSIYDGDEFEIQHARISCGDVEVPGATFDFIRRGSKLYWNGKLAGEISGTKDRWKIAINIHKDIRGERLKLVMEGEWDEIEISIVRDIYRDNEYYSYSGELLSN